MAPKGRKARRVVSAAGSSGPIPVTQAVRLQRAFDPASEVIARSTAISRARDEDAAFAQSWTPYGPLVKVLDLTYREQNGTMTNVQYVCPRALLQLLC